MYIYGTVNTNLKTQTLYSMPLKIITEINHQTKLAAIRLARRFERS